MTRTRISLAVATCAMLVAGLMTASPASASSASAAFDLPTCNAGTWINVYTSPVRQLFVPTRGGAYGCVLALNDYDNWGVVALQNMLAKCYQQNIAVDGDFGPDTKAALTNAQTWEKVYFHEDIVVNGRYGPQTNGVALWPAYLGGGGLNAPYICVDPA